jgi:para-aminobenzoate synthetase/4-amino-4-deoxychorismate lyase
VVVDREQGVAHYGTGGGVTIDSTAEGEYREALLKAEVLARRTADFRLLETIRWEPGAGLWLLDRHLNRLMESAWYVDIPIDRSDPEELLEAATAELNSGSVVRLLVDRIGKTTVEVSELPVAGALVLLAIDDRPIDRLEPLLYHKTTSRGVYEMAADRHPNAHDVVLWNEAGEVTETTICNLAVLIAGEWWTPPVSSGCLPGTYRAELLDQGRLIERVVLLDDLRRAESIARLNSVRGWEPAELAEE